MLKPYHKAELAFDIIQEIGGDGRNSRTFIVHDHQLDARVVAKQIEKARLSSPDEFFRESQALYASSHPNVVQIYYACFDADHVYIGMPYYQKGSVKSLISGPTSMTIREIVVAACQVLSGLHNIHSKRLVHLDVKPDNILLSERGEAMLSDFGQAKQMNFSGVAQQDRHYTPTVAPEAFDTDNLSVTFDVYQVGLTLYRMCNGNAAWYAQLEKYRKGKDFDRDAFRFDVRNGRFPDRRSFAAHVPSRLRKVVRKCLETDPANRYQSALEVANALAEVDGNTLDWRLTVGVDKHIWEKNEEGTLYELSVNADGTSTFYKRTKSGNRSRILDGCKASLSTRDAEKLLGSY